MFLTSFVPTTKPDRADTNHAVQTYKRDSRAWREPPVARGAYHPGETKVSDRRFPGPRESNDRRGRDRSPNPATRVPPGSPHALLTENSRLLKLECGLNRFAVGTPLTTWTINYPCESPAFSPTLVSSQAVPCTKAITLHA